jgi:hypothetical protein
VLAATWDQLATDPEMRQAFKEHGWEFSAATLEQALSIPVLRQSLDLGQFLLDYGCEAASWEPSRERIEQGLALDDRVLYAECKLSRRLRITVRDYDTCKGKMPADDARRPAARVGLPPCETATERCRAWVIYAAPPRTPEQAIQDYKNSGAQSPAPNPLLDAHPGPPPPRPEAL